VKQTASRAVHYQRDTTSRKQHDKRSNETKKKTKTRKQHSRETTDRHQEKPSNKGVAVGPKGARKMPDRDHTPIWEQGVLKKFPAATTNQAVPQRCRCSSLHFPEQRLLLNQVRLTCHGMRGNVQPATRQRKRDTTNQAQRAREAPNGTTSTYRASVPEAVTCRWTQCATTNQAGRLFVGRPIRGVQQM